MLSGDSGLPLPNDAIGLIKLLDRQYPMLRPDQIAAAAAVDARGLIADMRVRQLIDTYKHLYKLE